MSSPSSNPLKLSNFSLKHNPRLDLRLPDSNEHITIFDTLSDFALDMRPLIGSIVAIEGGIGIGKTTAGKSLERVLTQHGLKARFYPEQVNNDYLNMYLSDMKTHAFGFQINTLTRRIEVYKEATAFAKKGGIAILDRTLTGDLAFALKQKDNCFTKAEWDTYTKTINQCRVEAPSIVLYLDDTPENTYKRMISRGNIYETSSYTIEYFSEIRDKYSTVLSSLSTKQNVICVDWSQERCINNGYLDKQITIDLTYLIRDNLFKRSSYQSSHLVRSKKISD